MREIIDGGATSSPTAIAFAAERVGDGDLKPPIPTEADPFDGIKIADLRVIAAEEGADISGLRKRVDITATIVAHREANQVVNN
jgi:hypothetical protein